MSGRPRGDGRKPAKYAPTGCALSAEELVTLGEPVKRVVGAVVCGKVDLGEPGRLLVGCALAHCLGGA